ncbi:uncharacterized protein LY89DRAFT_660043 [Mollisia scopiformis]|uniref:AAA+ ATPase domain-containing protein n=1 Tax=Mollisia scopiformis TaxID=149040 RepID=A0A132B5T9_MOLSC|nr:uncharacterized protein LY89DRAFT_660043 [Mollisia scopiformis]KUJ07778.1 hypothetical protein LY89DRAFT_660043 [Mollisia scopiformis]
MSPDQPVRNDATSHLSAASIVGGPEMTAPTPAKSNSQDNNMISNANTNHSVPDVKEDELKVVDGENTAGNGVAGASEASSTTTKAVDTVTEVFAEASTNDQDNLHRSIQNAYRSQNFYGQSKNLFNQEKDDEKLDIRAKQAVLHLTWTDIRIKEMEKEIKLLRRDVDGLPADFEVKKTSKQPVYEHKLRRSNLSGFRLNDESKNIPDKQRPAVEVLISDHNAPRVSESTAESSENSPTNTVDPKIDASNRPATEGSIVSIPERLRIRSRALLSLLGRISGEELLSVGYTRNVENPAPVIFLRPFKLFVTYDEKIRAEVPALELKIEKEAQQAANVPEVPGVKKELPDFDNKDLLADLKLLIEFLDVDLKPTFELRRKIKEGTATHIEFQDLWHLFNPGDLIIDPAGDSEAFRVISYTGGREILIDKIDPVKKPTPLEGFMVDCYNLNYNGSVYGPKLYTHSIRRFRGLQPITSLPIYPMKFDPSFTTLKQTLIEQGTQYLELTKAPYAHKTLVGQTLDEPVEEIDAQVIVDMTLAINKNAEWNPDLKISEGDLTEPDKRETVIPIFCHHHPKYSEGCCGSDVTYKDQDWDESRFSTYFRDHRQSLAHRKAHEIEGDDIMLLPFWAYGFVLRSRRWITLRINALSEVKYESTFDDLVLPELHKDTVKALVQDHARSSAQNSAATSKVGAAMDLVRGKGKGLIILLHGEPGVGKTSTAECVADLTERPLFPVTCGDIGETAGEVQENLDYNFQLAHKWGCVLLLDEADVFLAKRGKSDMRRNAVVSVFLRTLEYYSGILFLTTNRVGSIDPAFKSRIHMSLFYPHLSLDATAKLYEVFIKRTVDEQKKSQMVEFKIKQKEILRFAKSHFKRLEKSGLSTWNGRQIRNAFQTAIALAEYEARQPGAELPFLGKSQFEIIAEASEEFDRYLKHTLGDTDADIARKENMRSDYFGAQHVGKPPSVARSGLRPSRRNGRDPESDFEVASETEEEDEDEDEDEEDGEDALENHRPGKAAAPGPSKTTTTVVTKEDFGEDDMEAFKQFMQFKKMSKK